MDPRCPKRALRVLCWTRKRLRVGPNGAVKRWIEEKKHRLEEKRRLENAKEAQLHIDWLSQKVGDQKALHSLRLQLVSSPAITTMDSDLDTDEVHQAQQQERVSTIVPAEYPYSDVNEVQQLQLEQQEIPIAVAEHSILFWLLCAVLDMWWIRHT